MSDFRQKNFDRHRFGKKLPATLKANLRTRIENRYLSDSMGKVDRILGYCDQATEDKDYGRSLKKMAALDEEENQDALIKKENIDHLRHYFYRKKNPEKDIKATNFGNCLN